MLACYTGGEKFLVGAKNEIEKKKWKNEIANGFWSETKSKKSL